MLSSYILKHQRHLSQAAGAGACTLVQALPAHGGSRSERVDAQDGNAMSGQGAELELVRRMASGDPQAMRELYEAYGQRLLAYALRLTQERALAEDVVQETLVSAWRSARKYRGEGRLAAWLLGIVHHKAMKAMRRRPLGLSEQMEESLIAPDASPEAAAQESERARQVQEGLKSLSADHRAVLELVFYQDLSLKEAAEVCGCPVGTVKSRLSYARRHLRVVLSQAAEREDW